jgi:hypothetical protein
VRRARKALVALGGTLVALVLAIAVASAIATARFRERYEAEKADLLRRGRGGSPGDAVPAARDPLPPPVVRYVERMRAAHVPAAKVAILRQRGGLRTAVDRPWMPFVAEQVYSMEPPAFVWLARAEIAPFVHLVARDAFVGGRGHMLVRLLGLLTVADARGAQIDRGAALRYWGEVLAFPERVLDPRLRWEPMDDRHARVTIEQDGLKLVAAVEFDADDLPVAVVAERFRDVGGEGVLTRWSGHFRAWKEIDGRPFPSRWESVWHLPEGEFSAVQMEILAVETE